MKASFRQGILSAKIDNGLPNFLSLTSVSSNRYVHHLAAEVATTLNFAHKHANYLVKVKELQNNAWGPFASVAQPRWLYWDLSLVDGKLTRGSTTLLPLFQTEAPLNPLNGQHWFDLTATTMKVWSDTSWVEYARVFACKLQNSTITYFPFGSQVNLNQEIDLGYILFDVDKKPIRITGGVFFTTDTVSLVDYAPNVSSFKLDQNVMALQAVESIPAHSFVCIAGDNLMALADIGNANKDAIGMVDSAVASGEISSVIFRGLVTAFDWSSATADNISEFGPTQIGKHVYLSNTGQFTFNAVSNSAAQKVGTIINKHSIYIDIDTINTQLVLLPPPSGPTATGATVVSIVVNGVETIIRTYN